MHADWNSYLQTLTFSAQAPTDKQAILAPLSHLAVLSVSGTDAANFLQGQVTCNVKTLSDAQPTLGAFCNAKGRTISTFIIIKQQAVYQLILTQDLLDTVRKKLQMYILRADVQLSDQNTHLCLLGVHNAALTEQSLLFPYPQLDNGLLLMGSPEQVQLFTRQCLAQDDFTLVDENVWRALEIQAGIPWLFQQTTESFVPQMLNLDKLHAISFDKGCYTGQEIVARTHYLGKNKRAMYRATCHTDSSINPGEMISDPENPESQLGTVVMAAKQTPSSQLLVVLKDQADSTINLQLNNQNHDKISVCY